MVLTPWGRGDELRRRMLGSGPRATPAEAARSQRERLFGAMVASCAERGYGATTVGDLITLAGVSRRDFYKHFTDKQACFLATLDEILAGATAIVKAKIRGETNWEDRAGASLDAFIAMVVAQPAAARLCLVESFSVGAVATGRVDARVADFQRIVELAFAERPQLRGMPREMTDALVGGLRKVVHTHLHRGTERKLVGLAPAMLEFATSYRPPPQPLRGMARKRTSGFAQAPPSDWARLANADDPAERITRTTMETIAERGYQATTIGEIAERAGVSLSTFYAHFSSKAEAFDAALYSGRTRMIGVAMPAFRRSRNWPESIRNLTKASYGYLAGEPEFAQLVTVAVLGAGSEAVERNETALEGAQWPFQEGRRLLAPELDPFVPEAVTYACYSLMCEWIQKRGARSLPGATALATYLGLCPFIGPDQACVVANGGSWVAGGAVKRPRPRP